MQVGFRNGMTLTARLSNGNQRNVNNGNATILDQNNFLGSLNYNFRLPESLSRRRKRISATLTARSDNSSTCLLRQGTSACTSVSENGTREVSASFNTDLAELLRGNLDFGYLVNDAPSLNRRVSTIYLQVGFTLSLYSGGLR